MCLRLWAVTASLSTYGSFDVDIFFAVSGLIITKPWVGESRRSSGINSTGFHLRTIRRSPNGTLGNRR